MTDPRSFSKGPAIRSAPTLHTDRTTLRMLCLEDFDDFHAMWAEPFVVKYIFGTPSTPQESWMRLLGQVGHWALLGFGYWAVTDRQSGAFLGALGFGEFMRPVDPPFHGTPEAGWTMTEAATGRGLAREALTCALAWADHELQGPRTFCMIAPENAASLKLAKAVGYTAPQALRYKEAEALLFSRKRL